MRKLCFGSEDQFEEFLGYSVAAFEVAGYPQRDTENVYINYSVPGKQVGRLTLRDDRTLFLLFSPTSAAARPIFTISVRKRSAPLAFRWSRLGVPVNPGGDGFLHGVVFRSVSQIRMKSWSKGRVGSSVMPLPARRSSPDKDRPSPMVAAYVLAGRTWRVWKLSRGGAPALREAAACFHARQAGRPRRNLPGRLRQRPGGGFPTQSCRTFGIPFCRQMDHWQHPARSPGATGLLGLGDGRKVCWLVEPMFGAPMSNV